MQSILVSYETPARGAQNGIVGSVVHLAIITDSDNRFHCIRREFAHSPPMDPPVSLVAVHLLLPSFMHRKPVEQISTGHDQPGSIPHGHQLADKMPIVLQRARKGNRTMLLYYEFKKASAPAGHRRQLQAQSSSPLV